VQGRWNDVISGSQSWHLAPLASCGLPMWMWLLGTNTGGDVESWAVLLHPAQSRVALVTSVVVFALGVAAYWTIAPRGAWRGQLTYESYDGPLRLRRAGWLP
jgi:hypothetical protein